MSGISGSSGSGSDFLLGEIIDESESWTSVLETGDDSSGDDLKILYGILCATGFFICLYNIRFWCDKKQGDKKQDNL